MHRNTRLPVDWDTMCKRLSEDGRDDCEGLGLMFRFFLSFESL